MNPPRGRHRRRHENTKTDASGQKSPRETQERVPSAKVIPEGQKNLTKFRKIVKKKAVQAQGSVQEPIVAEGKKNIPVQEKNNPHSSKNPKSNRNRWERKEPSSRFSSRRKKDSSKSNTGGLLVLEYRASWKSRADSALLAQKESKRRHAWNVHLEKHYRVWQKEYRTLELSCARCEEKISVSFLALASADHQRPFHIECAAKEIEEKSLSAPREDDEVLVYIGSGEFALMKKNEKGEHLPYKLIQKFSFESRDIKAHWQTTLRYPDFYQNFEEDLQKTSS